MAKLWACFPSYGKKELEGLLPYRYREYSEKTRQALLALASPEVRASLESVYVWRLENVGKLQADTWMLETQRKIHGWKAENILEGV